MINIFIMYKSYAFTLRPRNGVQPNSLCEKKAIKLVEKYNGFLVAEKEGEARHLHGQLFFPNGKRKFDLAKVLIKIQDAQDPAEIRVLKSGLKIAYSDDFYTEYTNKEDSKMICDKFIENPQDFYPTEEEQERVRIRANAADQKYNRLKELWDEQTQHTCLNQTNITLFLYQLMYVDKKIMIISDKKCFNQTAKSMYHYIAADQSLAMGYCFPDRPSGDPQAEFEEKMKKDFPALFPEK